MYRLENMVYHHLVVRSACLSVFIPSRKVSLVVDVAVISPFCSDVFFPTAVLKTGVSCVHTRRSFLGGCLDETVLVRLLELAL